MRNLVCLLVLSGTSFYHSTIYGEKYSVQAGICSELEQAQIVRDKIAEAIAESVYIFHAPPYYKIQIGPFLSSEAATFILSELRGKGYTGYIVTSPSLPVSSESPSVPVSSDTTSSQMSPPQRDPAMAGESAPTTSVPVSSRAKVSSYSKAVKNIPIREDSLKVKITILTDALEYNDFTLQGPDRVIIDFQRTLCKVSSKKSVNILPIISIRASQYAIKPIPVTRVVFDLSEKADYSITRVEGGIRLEFAKTIPGKRQKPPKIGEIEQAQVIHKKTKPVSKKKKIKRDVSKEKVVKKRPESIVAQIERPKKAVYKSRGKRDPFKPWLGLEGTLSDSLLDIFTATIVGIIWTPKEKYALAEGHGGKGYILCEGDKVRNGKVDAISKDKVVFALYGFGGIKKVTLKLIPKEKRKKEAKER